MALTRPRYSQIYDTDYKQTVRCATTGDVGNLIVGGTQTNSIDGITLAVNDRILVKDQGNSKQNGIYQVLTVGTGSNGVWRRALDADSSDKVTFGLSTTVGEGTVNGGRQYRLTTADPITLDATDLTFLYQSGLPGGSNTQVQYNKSGSLYGVGNLTFNDTNNSLAIVSNSSVSAFALDITGNAVVDGSLNAQLSISSSKAYNQSPISGISFSTKYNSAGDGAGLGGITVAKSNATDGDVTSYLSLHTRPAGGSIAERLRIDGNGNVVISATTTSTTVSTGALVVAGGVGIQGSVQGVAATFTGAVTLGSGSSNLLVAATTTSTSIATGALVVAGGAGIAGNTYVGGNVTIGGNLTVNGTTVTINANNLTIDDSLLYLAENNVADTLDIGLTAEIRNPTLNHIGFVRDATDSTWKLFSNVVTQPSTTVDFTNAIYSSLQIGNLTVVSNSSGNGYGRFGGVFDEATTLQGVWIGNAGSGTATPRIGFFNGNTTQNWQIDNNSGTFRWFTPGVSRMELNPNGNLSVPSTVTSGGLYSPFIGNTGATLYGTTANVLGVATIGQVSSPLIGNASAVHTGASLLATSGIISGNINSPSIGNASAVFTGATVNITGTGTIGNVQAVAVGNVSTLLTGAIQTPSQTGITTVGNLLSLSVSSTSLVYGTTTSVGALRANSTQTATSTTSGALISLGGAGIAGNLYIGGNLILSPQLTSYLGTTVGGGTDYDGVTIFSAHDTTAGRGVNINEQFFLLPGNVGAMGATIVWAYGAASNISLPPNTAWIIEWHIHFFKQAAGTMTFQITNNNNPPQWISAYASGSALAGNTAAQAAPLNAYNHNITTGNLVFPATGSITLNTYQRYLIKAHLVTHATNASKIGLQATAGASTTFTTLARSTIRVRKMFTGNIGSWGN